MSKDLTEREIEYLKTIFKHEGSRTPIGPAKIAQEMDTSRAGALKKLKKLQEKGFGIYIKSKGLKLNEEGLEKIREEIEKHHLLEKFLQETLDLPHEKSCQESTRIASATSKALLEVLKSKINSEIPCECGYEIGKDSSIEDLQGCHWFEKGGVKH